ncbi:hypothetical protein JTB14_030459 [Gonioctena quinquepunctata]|nr:hypothetical protein JTB14_030459 [Gonioctena quinquepunctata]
MDGIYPAYQQMAMDDLIPHLCKILKACMAKKSDPGHKGHQGNKKANELARQGSKPFCGKAKVRSNGERDKQQVGGKTGPKLVGTIPRAEAGKKFSQKTITFAHGRPTEQG